MRLPAEFELPLADVRARLPFPVDVRWYATVGSTMDLVAEAAVAGAPEGRVVVADEQTAGRGRRGREWSSPPGAGLYLSVLLRPGAEAAGRLSLVTLAAGVGVAAGVRAATGLEPELKWPNDLMVGRRKLAGILAEGIGVGADGQSVVLGVGINVQPAAYPPAIDAGATSIEGELGRPADRGRLLAEVLAGVCGAWRTLSRDGPDDILRAWRAAAPRATGATVEWEAAGVACRGITAGIDETGALLVRTPSGLERLIAGEVRWVT